jgi:2-dehydro-3-deoxyphosphogluconate aldolase/(4S)-4-hydroxy-2-oxoglutarate aldolase
MSSNGAWRWALTCCRLRHALGDHGRAEAGAEGGQILPCLGVRRLAGIRALSAAFPGLSFVPTGGVGPKNHADNLGFPPVLACGGSWMVDVQDLAETTRHCLEARAIAKEIRG